MEKEASKSGGPIVSRLTSWPFALIARSRKLPSWEEEMLDSTTWVPALAMSSNLASSVAGSSCFSMACWTHCWRWMRA
ncbi:hypothetical protein D3C85_1816720 [compost metagenome]